LENFSFLFNRWHEILMTSSRNKKGKQSFLYLKVLSTFRTQNNLNDSYENLAQWFAICYVL